MRLRHLLTGVIALMASCSAAAQPDYYRLELDIAIIKPAAEVWSKVGGYCDISEWLGLDCEITQGDGGIGTVRVLNGTIVELHGCPNRAVLRLYPARGRRSVLHPLSWLYGSKAGQRNHIQIDLHHDVGYLPIQRRED